ncbi:glucose 1-dehydrogenase [Sphingomonas sp. BAUL-RG-20F-R05-02]|uniref:glucose 1-dehydrogenase n=1 Tax=Sphingomonas sp. BAUL-RG-20F-R05-02 TaxID=2914830 RepID=UPI001F58E807|nr:glucose 1-dehydrogenase [Sphingomonas sp. BAUL-RG-20F-R05-02]
MMLLQSGVARAQAIATGAGIPFVVEVFSGSTICEIPMPTQHQPLIDHVAIVSGASSGIGLAVAEALADAGAAVAVNYRSGRDAAEDLVARITAGSGRAIAVQADVSKEDEVAALFEQTAAAFGRVDVLVANSGVQKDAAIADMTLEDWNTVIDINLTGQFLCAREAVRHFRAQPAAGRPARSAGVIVAMSSVHEVIPWAGHINYASAKGGIRMLTRTLAQEVASDGIRVNAIAPGAIKTPINQDAWDSDEALSKLLRLIPYGRIGDPEDVARAAVWLASDEADYVTGTTLFVDGGMSLYPEFRDNG